MSVIMSWTYYKHPNFYNFYVFRSKFREADPKDTAAAMEYLKSICYPYMKRFTDSVHEIGKQSHLINS